MKDSDTSLEDFGVSSNSLASNTSVRVISKKYDVLDPYGYAEYANEVNAINGIAAGGGVGLALTGDIVIASESAKFKLVIGPKLVIISDVGASWFVPNLIGRARANGMGLLGEDISAKQAKEWGLIWDCVPDEELISKAEEIAKKLANGPITGLKEIVKAHDKALSGSLSEQLDYEKETQRIRLDSKDFREGVTAFAEKRKPNFKDLD